MHTGDEIIVIICIIFQIIYNNGNNKVNNTFNMINEKYHIYINVLSSFDMIPEIQ